MPLPQGMSINTSTGALVGNPVASAAVNGEATDYTFTVQARTAAGAIARSRQTITVYPAPTVVVVAPAGVVGVAYTGSVTGSNGSGSYAYTVLSGALPTSVSIHAGTGALSGTPTVAGVYTGVFRVTAAYGGKTDTAFSITIT
jgi:large repetitive protein